MAALVGGGGEAAGGVVGLGGARVVGQGVRRGVWMDGLNQAIRGVVDHRGQVARAIGAGDDVAVGVVGRDLGNPGCPDSTFDRSRKCLGSTRTRLAY